MHSINHEPQRQSSITFAYVLSQTIHVVRKVRLLVFHKKAQCTFYNDLSNFIRSFNNNDEHCSLFRFQVELSLANTPFNLYMKAIIPLGN